MSFFQIDYSQIKNFIQFFSTHYSRTDFYYSLNIHSALKNAIMEKFNMTNQEKIQYLANLLYLTQLEQIKSSFTEKALNNIINYHGFDSKICNNAKKVIKQKDYMLKLVGLYSDQLKFFEDVMYIVYSDGKITGIGKKIIIKLVRELELTINQVKRIMRQTVRTSDFFTVCPQCQQRILKYKECPNCRNISNIKDGNTIIKSGQLSNKKMPKKDSSDKDVITQTSFKYPEKGIIIEFAKSRNTIFYDALKAANSAPKLERVNHDKKTWFLAYWPYKNISDTLPLVEKLQSIREKRCIIDGVNIPWEQVYGFYWCYHARIKSRNPDEYCLGIEQNKLFLWGCYQCKLSWGQWNDWLNCGYYNNEEKFVFEKNKITKLLQDNLFSFRFCPKIDFDLIQIITNSFPEQISVQKKIDKNVSISPTYFLEGIKILKKVSEQYDIKNSPVKAMLN